MRMVKVMRDKTPYGIQEKVNKWAKEYDVHLVNVTIQYFRTDDFMATILYEENNSSEEILNELESISCKLDDINGGIPVYEQ